METRTNSVISGFTVKVNFLTFFLILATPPIYCQNLQKPFEKCGVKGSITIFNLKEWKWISSDMEDSNRGSLPASTFKIFNSLMALETGAIADENDVILWPGETDTLKYGYRPDIYHDMTLREAFKSSAVWAYLELAARIEPEKYLEFMSRSGYGDGRISTEEDHDFWNFGDLAVSPVDQIQLLQGIYEGTLPFSKRTLEVVAKILIEEENDYILRAKTGWTRNGGKDIGWWVGYIEKPDNALFFATRIEKNRKIANPKFGPCRKSITLEILRQLNLL